MWKVVVAALFLFLTLGHPAKAQNLFVPNPPCPNNTQQIANTNWVNTCAIQTILASGGYINPKNPPYNAACDGVTDDTVAIQNAGNAAIAAGLALFIPPSTGGCIISQNASNNWSLKFTSPIVIVGFPGYSILFPKPGTSTSVNMIYFVGTSGGAQRTIVDGIMIANPSTGTYDGGNALFFDTTTVGNLFLRPQISRNYFGTPNSGGGWSIQANNNTGNTNGGFAYGNIFENLIGAGADFESSGDSIRMEHNVITHIGSNTSVNPGAQVNLITNAGNFQYVGNNCGIDQRCIYVECSATFDISGNELENNNNSISVSNVSLDANVCALAGGTVTNNEITVLGGSTNHPVPIYLGGSPTSGIVVDGNRIATFVGYTAILIGGNASNTHIGCNNYFVSVSGLSTITDNSTTTIYCRAHYYVGHSVHSATCATNTTCWFLNDIQTSGDVFVYNRTPLAGLFKGMRVFTGNGAPGAAQTYTVTFRKNSANTGITCTISGNASNSCNDTSHTVTSSQDDQWNFSIVTSNGAAVAQDIQWVIEFDPYTQ